MEELNPLRESKVSILTETKEESFDIFPSSEYKKDIAKKVLFEENSPEKFIEQFKKPSTDKYSYNEKQSLSKIQFEAAKSFFAEEPKKQSEIETLPEQKKEISSESKDECIEEIIIYKETPFQVLAPVKTEEIVEPEEINESKKRLKPKVNFKARLKIIIFGFVAVLTCFLGWSIYNAVEIETLRAQLEQSNKTYAVNIVNYISSIEKSDDLKLYSQDLSDAQIIPMQPAELENPVEYTIKSNWFDRLCDWLSRMLGR